MVTKEQAPAAAYARASVAMNGSASAQWDKVLAAYKEVDELKAVLKAILDAPGQLELAYARKLAREILSR